MSKQSMNDWFDDAIKACCDHKLKVRDPFKEHKPLMGKDDQSGYIVRLQRQMQVLDEELKFRSNQVAILTERLEKTNEALGRALARAAVQFGHLKAKE